MNAATVQERMKASLERLGLPHKELKVYGGQVMVTCWSRDAAEKWAGVLRKLGGKLYMGEGIDYAKVNKNTVLRPSILRVWRVWLNLRAGGAS